MKIGSKLLNIRQTNKLTMDELVEIFNKEHKLSVTRGMISRWENDKSTPSMTYLRTYAKVFHLNLNNLLCIDCNDDINDSQSGKGYYNNPETAKLVQELYDNPDRRVLLDATRNLRPEDVKALTLIINQMTKKESSD